MNQAAVLEKEFFFFFLEVRMCVFSRSVLLPSFVYTPNHPSAFFPSYFFFFLGGGGGRGSWAGHAYLVTHN